MQGLKWNSPQDFEQRRGTLKKKTCLTVCYKAKQMMNIMTQQLHFLESTLRSWKFVSTQKT